MMKLKSALCRLAIIFLMYLPSMSAQQGRLLFVAELNGANHVPVVRTDASGLVTFTVSDDFQMLEIHGVFANITGNLTGCGIHAGDRMVNGPVFLNLNDYVKGNRIVARIPTPALFVELATSGNLYLNVRSSFHINGEMRGQLDWRAEYVMPALLAGENVNPPVDSTGIALGAFRFSPNLTRMEFSVVPVALSSPIKELTLHRGAANSNGPVLAVLGTGPEMEGEVVDQLTVIEVLFAAFDTGVYAQISTEAHPDGEIRGQLILPPLFNGHGAAEGGEVIPPVVTNARGYGYAVLGYPQNDSLYYVLISDVQSPVSASIHTGVRGMTGPPVGLLNETSYPGIYSGALLLTPDDRTAFLNDGLYFNVATAANPAGEIRAQITCNLMHPFAFDLCGDQEVPKRTVPAYGAAYICVNKAGTEMEYALHTLDLNGDALTTFLNAGAFGSPGSKREALELPNPYSTGVVDIDASLANDLRNDNAFINVHTAANPSGEIRGQVRQSLSCAINTATGEASLKSQFWVSVSDGDCLQLKWDVEQALKGCLEVSDLHGRIWLSEPVDLMPGSGTLIKPVADLAPGLFVVKIMDSEGGELTRKFIKS